MNLHWTPFTPDWPEPHARFLKPSLPPAPKLPLKEVLAPSLAAWVRDASEAKGSPPDYVLGSLLAVAASLVGNARLCAPWQGWAEPCGLFVMCIGQPSAGKSPAIDAALHPLKEIERPKREAAKAERAKWDERVKVAEIAEKGWKASVKVALEEGKPAPTRPAEADAGPSPHIPRLVVQDTTIEKLGETLSEQAKGALVFRDELAGWLQSFERYSGGTDRPFWLEAYGGRFYSVDRKMSAPIDIPRLLVSILGGIQPDRLSSLLMKADDDGLLARFIPIWPEPVPIKRPERASDDEFITRVFERLDGLALYTDERDVERPWIVRLTDDARDRLDAFRVQLRAWEAEAEGLLLSFTGKLPGLSLRLALVLDFMRWAAEGGEEPHEIDGQAFERAARLVGEYILPMARRAYAAGSLPEVERGALRLVALIREEGWSRFTSREVLQRQRAGLHPLEKLEPVFARLEEGDCIRRLQPEAGKAGRPERAFAVNPVLFSGGFVGSVGFVSGGEAEKKVKE